VSEVATDDVPPTAYAIARSNVLRPDEITPSLTTEEVLSNAPEVEDDRFKVPRVVEVE
jgi:aspartyl-tRNA(Asn)/glutamyl-tRNA(Gln) amidotransferase subunit C